MRKILVTGGAGYIGAHTCKALAAQGYTPVVYDNLCAGKREAVRWGPFEYGDLGDAGRVADVLARHRPEAVMHFAAHAYVGESMQCPEKYYRNNVAGSLTLIEACVRQEIRHFVFSSSCAVYGEPPTSPITESTPLRPINPYGQSKLMVEQMLASASAAHSFDWMALRYFNAAGDDPSGETGEDHDPETRLIPQVLAAAADPAHKIIVFGVDYDTPDGTCVRDYIHVADLARAHVLALAALEHGAPSGPLNLGSERGYSVREIIASVEEVTGRPVGVTFAARRPGDPPVLIASSSRAREVLRWNPEISDIQTIISTAWNWHQIKQARRDGQGAAVGR